MAREAKALTRLPDCRQYPLRRLAKMATLARTRYRSLDVNYGITAAAAAPSVTKAQKRVVLAAPERRVGNHTGGGLYHRALPVGALRIESAKLSLVPLPVFLRLLGCAV